MYRKIITHYDPKPIPLREFDWNAVYDGYEPDDPQGFGATEDEAIMDLEDQVEAPEDCTCHAEGVGGPDERWVRDEWCPTHGRDPDQAYEEFRDRRSWES